MKVGKLGLIALVAGVAVWAMLDGFGGDHVSGTPEGLGAEAARLQAAGDHSASAARFEEAAALAMSAGLTDLARGYRAQAGVCFKLAGSVPRAHEIMLDVLADARATGDRKHLGLALGNLARLEDMGGDTAAGIGYLDQLAGFAREEDDALLEVLTLEQAATAAFSLGDLEGASARLKQALSTDLVLSASDRRRDALLALLASVRAGSGDDEGAEALWQMLNSSPASLANHARHLSDLGLHVEAADIAWLAVEGFNAEGADRVRQRDRALALHIAELLRAGELDACATQLDRVLRHDQPAEALAAFRVLSGRLALARRRAPDAIEPFRTALDSLADSRETELVSLLLAYALHQSERDADALLLLESLPESHARASLTTWVLTASPDDAELIGEAVPEFRSASFDPTDESLDQLADLVPMPLPSRALIAIEAGIADASRLRAAGAEAMAAVILTDSAQEALAWQAIDARRGVFGLPITAEGIAARAEVIHAWASRSMPADRALIAVIPGERGSYLLVCSAEHGASSFPLPPSSVLDKRAGEVVSALRGNELGTVARAAWQLDTTLLGKLARVDLEPATHWTFILPGSLAMVPPAMLVGQEPEPGQPVAWRLRERVISLLPHVLAVRDDKTPRGQGWLTVHAPSVDAARLSLTAAVWTARYGTAVWLATPVRDVDPSRELTGTRANVPLLAATVSGADGLRVSAPGAGAGRLGGLMLAPSTLAPSAGEVAGLLPWHRLADMDLPPDVILDGTRFDLGPGGGPSHVATAVLSRAQRLLLARWPLPGPVRDTMVERVRSRLGQGLALDDALAEVQRDFLQTAESAGGLAATHPRFWAALLPFGTD